MPGTRTLLGCGAGANWQKPAFGLIIDMNNRKASTTLRVSKSAAIRIFRANSSVSRFRNDGRSTDCSGDSESPDCELTRMDCGAKGTSPQGKGLTHMRDELSRQPPRLALGKSREEVCLREKKRQRNTRRPLPGSQPADYLSLHVWPGLERRLRRLLVSRGPHGRRHSAPGTSRCFLRCGFTRAQRKWAELFPGGLGPPP
jgi:hypothetical protein